MLSKYRAKEYTECAWCAKTRRRRFIVVHPLTGEQVCNPRLTYENKYELPPYVKDCVTHVPREITTSSDYSFYLYGVGL